LALRLFALASLPRVGALPLTGPPVFHLEPRLPLTSLSSPRRRWPLTFSLTRDAFCHLSSINPLVWAGGFALPTAETWRERYTPSRQRLHADLARNDPQRPLQALRRRWQLPAMRVTTRATPPAPARPTRATPRGWPPALASPLPG
jgi:hypothetical protein